MLTSCFIDLQDSITQNFNPSFQLISQTKHKGYAWYSFNTFYWISIGYGHHSTGYKYSGQTICMKFKAPWTKSYSRYNITLDGYNERQFIDVPKAFDPIIWPAAIRGPGEQ